MDQARTDTDDRDERADAVASVRAMLGNAAADPVLQTLTADAAAVPGAFLARKAIQVVAFGDGDTSVRWKSRPGTSLARSPRNLTSWQELLAAAQSSSR